MRRVSNFLSGRVPVRAPDEVDANRYSYLSLENAEPNLGLPINNNELLVSNTDGSRRFIEVSGSTNEIVVSANTTSLEIGLPDDVTISGNLVATNIDASNFNSTSDINFKENIVQIKDAVEKINQISGYTFTFKDTGLKSTGVIAQEVQEVLPEVVQQGGDRLTVSYGNMAGLFIEAIKDINKRLSDIEAQLDKLK